MQKWFTLAEAENLLPEVEKAIRDACDLKADYDLADASIEGLAQRISMEGGVRVDREQIIDTRARRDTSAAKLKDTIEHIHGLGCQVKDLEMGLVDFPTFYQGREVLLCWKLGESAIEYWHGTDEGFRGRKRIDREFREQHRASPDD